MQLIPSTFLFLLSLFSILFPTLGQCVSYVNPGKCKENCSDNRFGRWNDPGVAMNCPDVAFCERDCTCGQGYCYMGSCTETCTDTSGVLANMKSCTKDCNCVNGFCHTSDQFDSDTNPDHICGVPGTCLPYKDTTRCDDPKIETCVSTCSVDKPNCQAPECVMECKSYLSFVAFPKCKGFCEAYTRYDDLSACTHDCTAYDQYVDMSSCKYNCGCKKGKCDMSSCEGDTCDCGYNNDCGPQYNASTYPDSYGISGGAIGGISGAVAVFVAAVIAFFVWKRYKKKQDENTGAEYKPTFPVPDKAQDEEVEVHVAPTVPVVPVIPK